MDVLFSENLLAILFFSNVHLSIPQKIREINIFLTDICFCEQSTSILFWALVMNGLKALSITSGISSRSPWANDRSNIFSLRVVAFGVVWSLATA